MTEKILPIKHLSARVPWHDNKWNGTFCCNVIDNSFCRILPRIDGEKDPAKEKDGELIVEGNFPPCIAEKGTFLSKAEYTRKIDHNWSKINKLFKDMLPAIFHHKAFSFNAVPFLWMMKGSAQDGHASEKANVYELPYDPELEEQIDKQLGFEGNTWVQHPDNQKLMLDSFFNCLRKKDSLIFFYAKHTPLSEPNERIIVGVAKLRNAVGPIVNFNYPEGYGGHRSYLWDRCVEHTLTTENPDGFLLPYHDLLKLNSGGELDLRDFAVQAPDHMQFSYASELVEHDTAIDSLLRIAESLRKSEAILDRSFKAELKWIDNEISRIWDMRGAFPGMGSILSSIKIADGNSIAWDIERFIHEKDGDLLKTNPWVVFEECIAHPTKYFPERGEKIFNRTAQRIWTSLPPPKKELFQLMSRVQLNNDQAKILIDNQQDWIGTIEEILNNPYLLFEKTRYDFKDLLTFGQIDKAFVPPQRIADAFPFPANSALTDQLDERRVRAFTVMVLEEAADSGHSLLPVGDVLNRMEGKSSGEPFPITADVLAQQGGEDFFKVEVVTITNDSNVFLKLQRLVKIKELISSRIKKDRNNIRGARIEYDWLSLINNHPEIPPLDPDAPDHKEELAARREKAAALDILCNHRASVLIGPAGSGKTTLLKILEEIPEIKQHGVLKLAPTGKARVKMGHDAKTVAQFLYLTKRYDGSYNVYVMDDTAEKFSGARTIIIDESSMLTEEQLGAIFDALGPVDRMIFVGDYRQLPPIGTGRPFADIVNLLKPLQFTDKEIKSGPGYAELRRIRRQKRTGDERYDIVLSRCFGDEPSKDDIATFHDIASGVIKSDYLRMEKWYDSKDFRELFDRVIREELNLDGDAVKAFNRSIGAKDIGEFQYFNYGDAETKLEGWQIISPVNGYGHGVKEINKFVQMTYRRPFIELALNPEHRQRRVAKPKGTDNIVYGDKVISLKNARWRDDQWIRPKEKKATALNYFANGEIGSITGEFRGRGYSAKGEPQIQISFSTQPGYSYVFWPNQLSEDGKYPFELAYAITVHKAQGSGFSKVFFVLPSASPILSRELLYTALTRHEDRIIILHQGDFRDFVRLAGSEASATARRFTDLFFLPEIIQLERKFYDAKYVNVSERGERMISKSEVIIANCLYKYRSQISYAYESKLTLEKSGRSIKPDFTIEHLGNGRLFYWEHLGMMTQENYRQKWEKKLKGYLDDGFKLFTEASETDDRVLITTEENPNGGIDSKQFDEIVRTHILDNRG